MNLWWWWLKRKVEKIIIITINYIQMAVGGKWMKQWENGWMKWIEMKSIGPRWQWLFGKVYVNEYKSFPIKKSHLRLLLMVVVWYANTKWLVLLDRITRYYTANTFSSFSLSLSSFYHHYHWFILLSLFLSLS